MQHGVDLNSGYRSTEIQYIVLNTSNNPSHTSLREQDVHVHRPRVYSEDLGGPKRKLLMISKDKSMPGRITRGLFSTQRSVVR